MSATELRELIKENAVVLFSYEIVQLYGQHPGAPATDAFVIFTAGNPFIRGQHRPSGLWEPQVGGKIG
ncbi:hypothetical protein LTR56_004988 [Elasticomyces elasticus]|nr:hypothetical protein LTR22_015803 [Elasticomyces elasticus]KAK3652694.1 hypothetical protein LTR56_004988 [Elasticomyces elasticus]KAK4914624.1 hypothetical protein LTR49_017191 [Elasticomyces elasticus]KAK5753990.1 hypothetical protein LTS12_015956 [Elasticomyces elasticus]